jgi:hypothetical protein
MGATIFDHSLIIEVIICLLVIMLIASALTPISRCFLLNKVKTQHGDQQ